MGYSDEEWWERGLCRDANPTIFEQGDLRRGRPRRDGSYKKPGRDWSAAKATCAACPVQPACLEFTLSHAPPLGSDEMFAAGFTPEQLGKLRRKRGR